MTDIVFTTPSDATLPEAFALLERHKIRQLPVVDDGRLVGIVTDRDLRRPTVQGRPCTAADLYYFEEDLRVRDAMTREVRTIHADAEVYEAARLLRSLKVNALPVLDREGQLRGIVTATDLLAVLVELEVPTLEAPCD